MSCVNIFRRYSEPENRYTNGLISLLKISTKIESNILSKFGRLAGIALSKKADFKVLQGFESTADAEIFDDSSVILIETKRISGALSIDQIRRHLGKLDKYKQKNRKLVLLTPDNEQSHYLHQFARISPSKITHISWKTVIQLLRESQTTNSVLSYLVSDYIDEIREDIFEQDISSVIVKIRFGDKSGVYSDDYLDEFRNDEWRDWHTPKKYNELDGKGKKLILYDKNKGLVLEVEIKHVRRDPKRRSNSSYPWSNKFAENALRIYPKPIPLSIIKKIPDKTNKFMNFDRCSTSHWNLAREQYEWLVTHT